MAMVIKVLRLPHGEGLPLPSYATPGSCGADLYAALEEPVRIRPLERRTIPTGICLELPEGFHGEIRPRSGLAKSFGLTVLNCPGTIDPDYRGEIKVLVVNLGQEEVVIRRGDRIAQLVITKHEVVSFKEAEELGRTTRGARGFGSSGR